MQGHDAFELADGATEDFHSSESPCAVQRGLEKDPEALWRSSLAPTERDPSTHVLVLLGTQALHAWKPRWLWVISMLKNVLHRTCYSQNTNWSRTHHLRKTGICILYLTKEFVEGMEAAMTKSICLLSTIKPTTDETLWQNATCSSHLKFETSPAGRLGVRSRRYPVRTYRRRR